MQYLNILIKAVDNQPSLDIVNKIVIPFDITDTDNKLFNLPPHLITVILNNEVITAKLIGKDINVNVYTLHTSNLINLN
jgi:hypothetical protein